LEHILPRSAFGNVSLVSSTTANGKNVNSVWPGVIPPQPITIPFVDNLSDTRLVKARSIVLEFDPLDEVQPINTIWPEPIAEHHLQDEQANG
jgi:hypothetical protein